MCCLGLLLVLNLGMALCLGHKLAIVDWALTNNQSGWMLQVHSESFCDDVCNGMGGAPSCWSACDSQLENKRNQQLLSWDVQEPMDSTDSDIVVDSDTSGRMIGSGDHDYVPHGGGSAPPHGAPSGVSESSSASGESRGLDVVVEGEIVDRNGDELDVDMEIDLSASSRGPPPASRPQGPAPVTDQARPAPQSGRPNQARPVEAVGGGGGVKRRSLLPQIKDLTSLLQELKQLHGAQSEAGSASGETAETGAVVESASGSSSGSSSSSGSHARGGQQHSQQDHHGEAHSHQGHHSQGQGHPQRAPPKFLLNKNMFLGRHHQMR